MADHHFNTALILAGGAGIRLGELSHYLPKCLVPINNRPNITRQIEQCKAIGISRIIISISKKHGDILKLALSKIPNPGVEIRCEVEETPLGTIDGVIALSEQIKNNSCLLVLGDIYFPDANPFQSLGNSEMTVGITRHSPKRLIQCLTTHDQSGRLLSIKDKPRPEDLSDGQSRWAGYVGLGPGMFKCLKEAQEKNLIPGPFIGDLFEGVRRLGVQSKVAECIGPEINMNTTRDFLVASVLEFSGLSPSQHLKHLISELKIEYGVPERYAPVKAA